MDSSNTNALEVVPALGAPPAGGHGGAHGGAHGLKHAGVFMTNETEHALLHKVEELEKLTTCHHNARHNNPKPSHAHLDSIAPLCVTLKELLALATSEGGAGPQHQTSLVTRVNSSLAAAEHILAHTQKHPH